MSEKEAVIYMGARVPKKLYEEVVKLAEHNRRPLASELRAAIQSHVEAYKRFNPEIFLKHAAESLIE